MIDPSRFRKSQFADTCPMDDAPRAARRAQPSVPSVVPFQHNDTVAILDRAKMANPQWVVVFAQTKDGALVLNSTGVTITQMVGALFRAILALDA